MFIFLQVKQNAESAILKDHAMKWPKMIGFAQSVNLLFLDPKHTAKNVTSIATDAQNQPGILKKLAMNVVYV